ncbi:MAG: glycerol-3-phosphate 1-O-acyltransferase PlsY [Zoogloeaceae bacterium]|jgi:glycerol-3-phosphate acyltransferase PlsY|nr:glycerol-3-phosphate 1-O-acyltransferase PlsY [Zoogloeaceae bacterium]
MTVSWHILAFSCLAAYLLGSVPFAVVSSRLFRLADPRTYGSGNPGATNVLRTGNKKAAVITLIGDAGKGAVAVLAARAAGFSEFEVGLIALAVLIGHIYPIFLKFKGGKGVATAAGALFALSFWVGLATLVTWLVTAKISRYSSLAALLAALSAPLWVWLLEDDGSMVTVILFSIILIVRHRDNIARLVRGEEGKIGARP